jgi:hypothetical protein
VDSLAPIRGLVVEAPNRIHGTVRRRPKQI